MSREGLCLYVQLVPSFLMLAFLLEGFSSLFAFCGFGCGRKKYMALVSEPSVQFNVSLNWFSVRLEELLVNDL